jgi:hypothetical protein
MNKRDWVQWARHGPVVSATRIAARSDAGSLLSMIWVISCLLRIGVGEGSPSSAAGRIGRPAHFFGDSRVKRQRPA